MPPNRWSLENNAYWASHVFQNIADLCALKSENCADLIGVTGHIPRLTYDSILDGSAKCYEKLSWVKGKEGQHTLANYNNFLASGIYINNKLV